jgi:hypothetical protein
MPRFSTAYSASNTSRSNSTTAWSVRLLREHDGVGVGDAALDVHVLQPVRHDQLQRHVGVGRLDKLLVRRLLAGLLGRLLAVQDRLLAAGALRRRATP